jgi:asparagine synthetase B (glutamine-hydrolysing)
LLEKTSFDKESISILNNIYNLITDEKLRTIFTKHYYEEIRDLHKEVIHNYLNKGIKRPFHLYFLLLLNEHGRRGTLCGNLMNNLFLETRMPSYDNDLMNFAFDLPISLREYQYLYRLVFSRKFPTLAKIKREYYNLPITAPTWQFRLKTMENKIVTKLQQSPVHWAIKDIIRYNRPKYVSHNAWFKNELKQLLSEILFDNRTTSRGIFDPAGLEKLFSEHQNATTDNSGLLWQIVNLEYFYRNFID